MAIARTLRGVVEDRQRQREAIELRKAGMTYAAIARHLGYSDAGSARHAVVRAIEQMESDGAQIVLAIHLQQYATWQSLLWPRATRREVLADRKGRPILDERGEPQVLLADDALPFIDRFIGIMGKQERLLSGAIAEQVTKMADEAVTGTLVIGADDEVSFAERVRQLVARQDRSQDHVGLTPSGTEPT